MKAAGDAGFESIVPEGHEADFPRTVFQEQLTLALATQLGITLAKPEEKVDFGNYGHLLNGIETRL